MFTEPMDRAFIAKLLCVNFRKEPTPVVMTISPGNKGWLGLDPTRGNPATTPLTLRFDYLEQTEDRIHYRIRNASKQPYHGCSLDSSHDGWLGFYESVSEEVFWKIEVIGTYSGLGDERPMFKLRDHLGYTVKSRPNFKSTYLTTGGSSEPLRFILSDYKII